jgi:hypothetical protein
MSQEVHYLSLRSLYDEETVESLLRWNESHVNGRPWGSYMHDP